MRCPYVKRGLTVFIQRDFLTIGTGLREYELKTRRRLLDYCEATGAARPAVP